MYSKTLSATTPILSKKASYCTYINKQKQFMVPYIRYREKHLTKKSKIIKISVNKTHIKL